MLYRKLCMQFSHTSSVMKWLPNLYFSSLVESASGRNFSFSLDSLFQLSAAAAVPVQRNHTKSYNGPEITPHAFHWKKPPGVFQCVWGSVFFLQQNAMALLKWNEWEVTAARLWSCVISVCTNLLKEQWCHQSMQTQRLSINILLQMTITSPAKG